MSIYERIFNKEVFQLLLGVILFSFATIAVVHYVLHNVFVGRVGWENIEVALMLSEIDPLSFKEIVITGIVIPVGLFFFKMNAVCYYFLILRLTSGTSMSMSMITTLTNEMVEGGVLSALGKSYRKLSNTFLYSGVLFGIFYWVNYVNLNYWIYIAVGTLILFNTALVIARIFIVLWKLAKTDGEISKSMAL